MTILSTDFLAIVSPVEQLVRTHECFEVGDEEGPLLFGGVADELVVVLGLVLLEGPVGHLPQESLESQLSPARILGGRHHSSLGVLDQDLLA